MFNVSDDSNCYVLDIGSQNIKFVHLRRILDKEEKYYIEAVDKESVLYDISEEIPQLEKRQFYLEALDKLVLRNKLKNKKIFTSISGTSVIVRFITTNKMTREELEKTIRYEAEPYIPFDMTEVDIVFDIIGETLDGTTMKNEVSLIAAKKTAIEDKIDLLTSNDLRPVVLDVDAFAIEHLCAHLKIAQEKSILFINIGATVTNLVIIEKGLAKVVRDITIGGNEFTKVLRMHRDLDFFQAEKEKVTRKYETSSDTDKKDGIGADLSSSEIKFLGAGGSVEKEPVKNEEPIDDQSVHPMFKPVVSEIIDELQRSINYYHAQTGEINISEIYLTGGGSKIKNLEIVIENELEIPVKIFNPFQHFQPFRNYEINPQLVNSGVLFTVAFGAALRSLSKVSIKEQFQHLFKRK
ncbi:type IV pilus assembly protein PilM [bacterium]